LSVFWENSLWVSLPFCRPTSHNGHFENHLIWVDLSLMVPWLVLRLLASDNKDQPPPPDYLENLLIWVDLIRVISVCFVQYVPWAPSRIPQLILDTLVNFLN
jgi:hypothetical protein